MDSVTPDPKPDRRIIDPAALRRKLAHDRMCRMCGAQRADQPHHMLHKKSMRGDDVEDNIIPLCFTCHVRYHDHGPLEVDLTAREVAYAVRKLGKDKALDYLRRRYHYSA